jgi:hypothetical protein
MWIERELRSGLVANSTPKKAMAKGATAKKMRLLSDRRPSLVEEREDLSEGVATTCRLTDRHRGTVASGG